MIIGVRLKFVKNAADIFIFSIKTLLVITFGLALSFMQTTLQIMRMDDISSVNSIWHIRGGELRN